jgi:hypothetical protein
MDAIRIHGNWILLFIIGITSLQVPLQSQQKSISSPPSQQSSTAKSGNAPQATGGSASSGNLVLDGATFGNLTDPEMVQIVKSNITIFFDLNMIRSNLSLLEDPQLMRYFVTINNCGPKTGQDNRVRKVLSNELDYPTIAKFYKAKAPEFLAVVPRTAKVNLGYAALGAYDTTKGVFPLVMQRVGKPIQITMPAQGPIDATNNMVGVGGACAEARDARAASEDAGVLGKVYVFETGTTLTFSEVHMNIEAARAFIESSSSDRVVRFDAEVSLPEGGAPKVIKNCNNKLNRTCVEFPAKLEKVTVIRPGSTNKGILGSTVTPDQVIATAYP